MNNWNEIVNSLIESNKNNTDKSKVCCYRTSKCTLRMVEDDLIEIVSLDDFVCLNIVDAITYLNEHFEF